MLEKYAENAKKKHSTDLQVVYSLGGYMGKNLRFLLVTEDKLEESRSKLEKVLYAHVYSVQKGKLENLNLLYNSTQTELRKSVEQCTRHSGIKCTQVKVKTNEQLVTERPKPVEANKNPEPVAKPIKAEPLKESNEIKHETAPASVAKKPAPIGNKPPAIAALFAKHHVKDPEKKKAEEEAKKKVEEASKKPASTNKRVVREPSDDEGEEMDSNPTKATNGSSKRFKLSENESKATKPDSKGTKKAKGNSNKKETKPQRKRIQQISDSESSDEGNFRIFLSLQCSDLVYLIITGEEEDMMVSSPEMAIKPIPVLEDEDEDMLEATVIEETKPVKNKGRKLVSKTVMGEDGFVGNSTFFKIKGNNLTNSIFLPLVTTKEYVPCDLDEEDSAPASVGSKASDKKPDPVPVKSEPPPTTTKRASPPVKGKQQSIMSFFTRK